MKSLGKVLEYPFTRLRAAMPAKRTPITYVTILHKRKRETKVDMNPES